MDLGQNRNDGNDHDDNDDDDGQLEKFAALNDLLSSATSKETTVDLDDERVRLEMALNEVQHDANK